MNEELIISMATSVILAIVESLDKKAKLSLPYAQSFLADVILKARLS
jgi:hypothetical protein